MGNGLKQGQGRPPGKMTLEPGVEGAVSIAREERSGQEESKGQKACLGHSWNSQEEVRVAGAILARRKQEETRAWLHGHMCRTW